MYAVNKIKSLPLNWDRLFCLVLFNQAHANFKRFAVFVLGSFRYAVQNCFFKAFGTYNAGKFNQRAQRDNVGKQNFAKAFACAVGNRQFVNFAAEIGNLAYKPLWVIGSS